MFCAVWINKKIFIIKKIKIRDELYFYEHKPLVLILSTLKISNFNELFGRATLYCQAQLLKKFPNAKFSLSCQIICSVMAFTKSSKHIQIRILLYFI